MDKGKDIQILLSTYNGERYLREQLNSYISQELFSRTKVFIRDDGSVDGTVNILHEYKENFGFEIIEGSNIGVNASINELIELCDENCSFFAISDQDDVWFPDKLTKAVKALENGRSDLPELFASCSAVTDSELNIIGKTESPKRGVSFYNAMIQNICPGHTQVFNRAMLKELRRLTRNDINRVHVIDQWIYLVSSAFGRVFFCEDETVLHRQHKNNAVGYRSGYFGKTAMRIKRLNLRRPDEMTIQLRCFWDMYHLTKAKSPYIKETEDFLNSNTFFRRVLYTLKTKCYRQSLMDSFLFRCLFLIGKYHE